MSYFWIPKADYREIPDLGPEAADYEGFFDSIRSVLHVDGATLEAPDGICWVGEGFLHEGFDAGDGPELFYYQPAVKKVSSDIPGVGVDVHFHPALARIRLGLELEVDSWVDIDPVHPSVVDHTGFARYRNCTVTVDSGMPSPPNGKDGFIFSGGGELDYKRARSSGTDGLGQVGRRAWARIWDVEGDFFGVLLIGDWAIPQFGHGNQVYGVNLIDGSRNQLSGFERPSTVAGVAFGDIDERNPPWGQGFDPPPDWTESLYNVVGALDEETLILQVEERDWTTDIASDFVKPKTWTVAPPSWADPELHPYAGESYQVTETLHDRWVYHRPEDADHEIPDYRPGASGTIPDLLALGMPMDRADGPGYGKIPLNPDVLSVLPAAAAEDAPNPTDHRRFLTEAEARGMINSQMIAELQSAAEGSVFRGFRIKETRVYYALLAVANLEEVSRYTPEEIRYAGNQPIVRGKSLVLTDQGLGIFGYRDLFNNIDTRKPWTDYTGTTGYKPMDKTPPGGYTARGGNEGFLGPIGDWIHYVVEGAIEDPPRTQWWVQSAHIGLGFGGGSPRALYVIDVTFELVEDPEAPDFIQATRIFGIEPTYIQRTRIVAPTYDGGDGLPKLVKPLPHHGARYCTDGERLIFVPRCQSNPPYWIDTSAPDAYSSLENIPAWNQAVQDKAIICLERSGLTWREVWRVNTCDLMGAITNEDTGRINEQSGDCVANPVLTAENLYVILWGALGEAAIVFDKRTGELKGSRVYSQTRVVDSRDADQRDTLMIRNGRLMVMTSAGYRVLGDAA